MQTVRLGRTGLSVSVAGLGCGGHSRLGMARGKDVHHAADMVRRALDLGSTSSTPPAPTAPRRRWGWA